MPGSEYSNDLKSRIHHLALMGFTARETSVILAIPESTVYRVLACEAGSFVPDHNRRTGRPRDLSRADIEACVLSQVRNWITLKCSVQFLLHISETQPDLYLDELKEELELEGMSISLASLCRYLHRNGVTQKGGIAATMYSLRLTSTQSCPGLLGSVIVNVVLNLWTTFSSTIQLSWCQLTRQLSMPAT